MCVGGQGSRAVERPPVSLVALCRALPSPDMTGQAPRSSALPAAWTACGSGHPPSQESPVPCAAVLGAWLGAGMHPQTPLGQVPCPPSLTRSHSHAPLHWYLQPPPCTSVAKTEGPGYPGPALPSCTPCPTAPVCWPTHGRHAQPPFPALGTPCRSLPSAPELPQQRPRPGGRQKESSGASLGGQRD